MPRGPKGEKRPADVIGAAVKVMRIATGEVEEDIDKPEAGKNPAAVAHWASFHVILVSRTNSTRSPQYPSSTSNSGVASNSLTCSWCSRTNSQQS